MTELLIQVLAWLAGGLLGALFYGGLWWTVKMSVSSQRPAQLFLISVLLRMSIALSGFYFIGGGQWQRLLLCLLGFVMARVAVTRLTRVAELEEPNSTQAATHAS
ncbi:ATP synthase subunit I [soil metagenome]